MIKRVIFLSENIFTLRDYERFGINLLQKNGFRIEVWDLSHILHPKLVRNFNPQGSADFEGLELVREKQKMKQKLSTLSVRDFVINMVSYRFATLDVYRALSKSSVDYAVFYADILPALKNTISGSLGAWLWAKIRQLASLRYLTAWENLFMKLSPRCIGVRPAKLILLGGEKAINGQYLVNGKTERLQIHALDYDIYLKERCTGSSKKNIAVFLDQFLPFHPDYIMFSEKSSTSAEEYYKLLDGFFDAVEKNTGLEVVIAAHPRSYYEKLPDYFNGRRCIKDRTIELVRDSQLVLTQGSTAINFANLYYKPMIFFTFFNFDKTWDGILNREIAKCYGKSPVFIDGNNGINWEKELKVDRAFYDDYRKSYIKAEYSEDSFFWQVVADKLISY